MSCGIWEWLPLHEVAPEVRGSITCAAGTEYELWSVPSFATGHPEVVDGAAVKSAKRPVDPGDVLICKINPRINRVWRVGASRGLSQVASPEWITVRPASVGRLDPTFLRHYLSAPRFRDWIVGQVSGVTGSHTRAKPALVMAQRVPVPPLSEQRWIIEIIEDHLSRLDAADRNLVRARKRAASMVLSARQRLVDQAKTKSERYTLGEIATVGTGTTPSRSEPHYYQEGTVPWVTSGELAQGVVKRPVQYVTDAAVAETSLKLYPAGTLLIAMYGEGKTRGTVAELGLPATTNQACAAVQVRDASLRPWVREVLSANYSAMRRLATGGVQPNLNLGLVREIEIPLPDEQIRSRLLTEVQVALESAQVLTRDIDISITRLDALRWALFAAAFEGKLTGRDTDTEMSEEAYA